MVDVSIIGYAAALPGAPSTEDVWQVLAKGRCTVSQIPEERWGSALFLNPAGPERGRSYVRHAGVLDAPYAFDAAYFGMSAREAQQLDPQQRLLLETTARAFDHAGIDPSRLERERVGVFIGASSSDHSTVALQNPALIDAQYMLGNTLSILSNRISYQWDFAGPSLTVDTACASSLFALDQARRAIEGGEIDTAVVGGVNMLLSPVPFVGFAQAQMLSPGGRCRAFAEGADGYVRSEGAVVFILQRASVASYEKLIQRSVLVGTAINSDGRTHGIALPSCAAQERLLSSVIARLGIEPDDLAFIEAHGTGTAVGDPVEAMAIGNTYGQRRSSPLPIGSAKTNFGHLEPASGLVGLLKAQLALEHGMIPASLHAEELNPRIDFEHLNLIVQREALALPRHERGWAAGVNSFGFGGANAHAVIRQSARPVPVAKEARLPPSLLLTAATEASLRQVVEIWRRKAKSQGKTLGESIVAANRRVARHPLRLVVRAESVGQLEDSLDAWLQTGDGPVVSTRRAAGGGKAQPVAFVFAGNGAVWDGMARHMFMGDETFRKSFLQTAAEFADLGVANLGSALTAPDLKDRLQDACVAQPLMYAIQLALVDALAAAGVLPDAVLGHSLGEVAASVAARRLTRHDGARIVATRSAAFAPLVGTGGMAALAAPADICMALIEELSLPIDLAAENAPASVTVSGPVDQLRNLIKEARKRRIAGRLLEIPYPYHSRAVATLEETLTAQLSTISSRPSEIAFFSGWRGDRADSVALDSGYWWNNARQPVRFRSAVDAAQEAGIGLFLEISPRTVLKSYLQDTLENAGSAAQVLESLDPLHAEERDAAAIARQVVAAGGRTLEDLTLGPRRPLGAGVPDYPFERHDFHLDSDEGLDLFARRIRHPFLGTRRDPAAFDWNGSLSLALAPWLADHEVDGRILFPAMGMVDILAHAACEAHETSRCELRNVDFLAPVELQEGGVVPLRTRFDPDSRRVSLMARLAGTWRLVAVASIYTAVDDDPETAPGPVPAGSAEILYHALKAAGLSYGPAFARVARIGAGSDVATCQLTSGSETGPTERWITGADAALHGIGAMLERRRRPMLPVHFDRLRIEIGSTIAAAQITRGSPGTDTSSFNLQCTDVDNRMVLAATGLVLRELPAASGGAPLAWDEIPVRVSGTAQPRVIADAVARQARAADAPATDLDVLRAALAGRMAWDIVAGTANGPERDPRLPRAVRLLKSLALLEGEGPDLHLSGECPWPGLGTLLQALIETEPGAIEEVMLVLQDHESARPARSSGRAILRRIARQILSEAPEAPRGRALLIGQADRGLISTLRKHAQQVTVAAENEERLDALRARLEGETALRFATLADCAGSGGYDIVVGIGLSQTLSAEAMRHLPLCAARGCEFLFVEEELDGLTLLTGPEEPRDGPEELITALKDVAEIGMFRSRVTESVALLHGIAAVGGVANHGTGTVHWLEDGQSPAALAHAMLSATNGQDTAPLWFVSFEEDRFEELTGWRRSLANETGADLRIAVVAPGTPAQRVECLLAETAERELRIDGDAAHAPRLVPCPERVQSGERLVLGYDGGRRGLDALTWQARERQAPGPGEIEIEVCATGLNFRDVMVAQGVLGPEMFAGGFCGDGLGMECAGRILRVGSDVTLAPGTAVMAFARSAFASHVTVPAATVMQLPDRVDFTTGAELPVVFSTADYALRELTRLQAGESVLIHGAAGGVGLAAVQMARLIGARIFATAGTPEKRRLLAALGAAQVFDSRSLDFDAKVKAATGGRGVDVVINSLAGEAMERSVGCLAPFGRFVELGKRDIAANTGIGLRALRNNISYFAVDVDQLLAHRPEIVARSMARLRADFESEALVPIPVESFAPEDVDAAFRKMQRSEHIGKIVVEAPRPPLGCAAPSPTPAPIRGAWLITGGTGGFGLETARWLAEHGATNLWLVSRSGQLADSARADLADLGVGVHLRAVDVTDRESLSRVVDEMADSGQELRGVVHAAMVLDDAYLAEMNAARIDSILAPKIEGARALDAATRKLTLDHFWLYSSVAARFGNPGQAPYVAANRALEGLAIRRRAAGLPALAIAWGPLGDAGYLARNPALGEALSARLGPLMGARESLDRLWDVLAANPERATITIARMDWRRLKSNLPVVSEPLFELLDLQSSAVEETQTSLAELIAVLGADKARGTVLELLREETARILRVAPAEVDTLRPLTEMGFDSLMAMNLKLVAEERLGTDLPMLSMGDDHSLAGLVRALFDRFERGHEQGPSDLTADAMVRGHLTESGVSEAERTRILRIAAGGGQHDG